MTTPDYAGLIAAWEAAMDGVTPGPWRPSTFGFQIVSDFPEAAWQSVVELRTIACTAPHVENEMKSQETIARWLARCSPDNISALLSALRTLLERNAALERERDEARRQSDRFCDKYLAALSRAEAAEAERNRLAKRVADLEADMNEFLRRVGPRWCLEQSWFPASMDPDRAVARSLVKGGGEKTDWLLSQIARQDEWDENPGGHPLLGTSGFKGMDK